MSEHESPTGFYDALAPLFDVMTDWEARLATEGPWLRALLEPSGVRRVLDAACGSGGHALWLAQQGYQVIGTDASPLMLELARRKAAELGVSVPFLVADLSGQLAISTAPSNGENGLGTGLFDAALVLGNSLPHLLTQAELVAALRAIAAVLRPGGLFITQNLNYDLRWRKRPRWFAAQGGVHGGREVLIWRFADYDDLHGRIAFHIALFAREDAGWKVEVHTTPQRPLFLADLVAGLSEAGFAEIRTFGRMALPWEPFDPDRSGDLVAVAVKSAAG